MKGFPAIFPGEQVNYSTNGAFLQEKGGFAHIARKKVGKLVSFAPMWQSA